MTTEQQVQKALQLAFQEFLNDADIEGVVVAEKIHDGTAGQPQGEEYPAIVIITGTPVPDGNKSYNLMIPCFIRAMSLLSDARTKQEYAELCEAVFMTIQTVYDWTQYETNSENVHIGDLVIDAGEEPVMDGAGMIIQETRCTIHACYQPRES